MAELNCGLVHPQSRASGRFGHVVVSNLSGAPQSNSDSEPTFGDKNDAIELGKVPEGKPSGLFEF